MTNKNKIIFSVFIIINFFSFISCGNADVKGKLFQHEYGMTIEFDNESNKAFYINEIGTYKIDKKDVIISLPNAGIMFLIACGATIFRKIVNLDNPSASPASVCPLSTDCMPLRITSATYAAELSPNASIAVIICGNPLIANITKNIINNCKAIGVPRIIVVYILQINFGIIIHRDFCAVSTNAITVPSISPMIIAKNEI